MCLDFANTVDWDAHCCPADPDRTDILTTPEMLSQWSARNGLAADIPDAAELICVRRLREALHRTFTAIAAADRPRTGDLEVLRESVTAAADAGVWCHDAPSWKLAWPPPQPAAARFAVAIDALDLLGDPQRLARVARCPGRECGWLFINASGRRRWCSMSTCGSREKTRRSYTRRKAAGAPSPNPDR